MDERDLKATRARAMKTGHENPAAPSAKPPIGVTLEPELQSHIGRHLRAIYDEVVNEPVPDRFFQLLEELERKQAERS